MAKNSPTIGGPKSVSVVLAVLASLGWAGDVVWAAQNEASTKADAGVVALVNGDAITRRDLRRVQTDLLALIRYQGTLGDEEPDHQGLEQVAVRNLIRRRLILQEAARRKLSVSDDEFDQALAELRRRFGDLESFGAWMLERGLDDLSLAEAIRGDLLTRRVTAALSEEAKVTADQVEDYYEAHEEDLVIGQEVRLRIIAVDSNEAGEEILAALSSGENFSRLARKQSLGLRADKGGDTGWVDLLMLPAPLQLVVARLEEGQAYGPLRKNADQFLIVALAGRRSVRAKSLDEARPEIERRLLAAKRRDVIEAWLAHQVEQSTIEVFIPAEGGRTSNKRYREQI